MNWLRFLWVGALLINTAGLARATNAEAETRYRTINVDGLAIFYGEAVPYLPVGLQHFGFILELQKNPED